MEFFRVAAALGAVFALLGMVYFLSSRVRRDAAVKAFRAPAIWPRNLRIAKPLESDSVKVLKRVPLTATHQLHLVGTSQDTFLLCTHPQGCTVLWNRVARAHAERDSIAPSDVGRYAS